MEPGPEKLPEWIQALAGLLLLGIIFLGGYWLQMKEKKDRALEREKLQDASQEKNEP